MSQCNLCFGRGVIGSGNPGEPSHTCECRKHADAVAACEKIWPGHAWATVQPQALGQSVKTKTLLHMPEGIMQQAIMASAMKDAKAVVINYQFVTGLELLTSKTLLNGCLGSNSRGVLVIRVGDPTDQMVRVIRDLVVSRGAYSKATLVLTDVGGWENEVSWDAVIQPQIKPATVTEIRKKSANGFNLSSVEELLGEIQPLQPYRPPTRASKNC